MGKLFRCIFCIFYICLNQNKTQEFVDNCLKSIINEELNNIFNDKYDNFKENVFNLI